MRLFTSNSSITYGPEPIATSILLSSSLAPVASNHAFDITGRPPTIGIASRLDASGLKKYFIFLGPKTCVSVTVCSKIAL